MVFCKILVSFTIYILVRSKNKNIMKLPDTNEKEETKQKCAEIAEEFAVNFIIWAGYATDKKELKQYKLTK